MGAHVEEGAAAVIAMYILYICVDERQMTFFSLLRNSRFLSPAEQVPSSMSRAESCLFWSPPINACTKP